MDRHKPSTFSDVFSAFTGSKTGPLDKGPRSELDSSLRQYTHKKLFTFGLDMTNKGLGINTDVPLPPDKADIYKRDARRVQAGEMSSTTAFSHSAVDWAKRGDIPGMVMNTLGAMGAAVYEGNQEYIARKTGKW